MHKLTSTGAIMRACRRRTYVGAREQFAADEDDHTKMNAWVLLVWGSAWRPSAAGAPL